jgi:hypothetical protein
MSQEVPPGDMLFGCVVLVIFLVLVFALGKVIYELKSSRFTKAWGTLVPIINGTVTNDGGGAATSWLTGTYSGRQVRASMIPNRNRYQGEAGSYYNYFDVALLEVAGSQDWSVEYRTALWGIQEEGWHIESKDAGLKERLHAYGIIDLLSRFGAPKVKYQSRERTLLYSEDVTPLWTSTPERFREELELLVQLAQINTKVNPA